MRAATDNSGRADPTAEAAAGIRLHLLLAFLFGGLVNLLFLASPLYMMQLYGRVLNSRSVETLVSISIALALAVVLMGAADAARGRLLARAAARLASRLYVPTAHHALVKGNGRLATQLADVETVRKFVGGGAVATLMDTPFTLLFLFVLFLVHPMLGLVATLGGAAILIVIGLARLVEAPRERRIAESTRVVAGVGGALGGDRGEIRALGLVHGLAARLAADHTEICRMQLASGEVSASVSATARSFRLAAHSAALATGALLAIEGALAPSAMLAAAILAGRALGPIEALPGALRSARLAREAAHRLEKAVATGSMTNRQVLGRDRTPATVEVRRLVVVPNGSTRAALRSLSFTVDAGEVVSIAGPSGAGKSTLLRCLAGADPIRSGEVRIAGRDVGGDDGAIVGWLPQDAPLYPGTIRANIASFGNASDSAVRAAARRAGASEAIERLARGFDTPLDAGGVSPGLRQSIAFARALLPQPDLLLLDQPTAHLDAAGEVAVLNVIRSLKAEGVTILVVSHKPVLAALADRVMLMREGTIEVLEDRETVLNAMRRQAIRPVSRQAHIAESAS
jgi:PrtD family type I secretion system ABC transporter